MRIDGEEESRAPFNAGLPQGSLLSPVLFILYTSTVSAAYKTVEKETCYVDDKIMLQGSLSHPRALASLTSSFREKIRRAEFVNINFAPKKAYLIHLIPWFTNAKPNERNSVYFGPQVILPR